MTARVGVCATAPGKLFLTGEWAVLVGAPAIVAAVDRRVTVRVTPTVETSLVVDSRAEGLQRTISDRTASLPGGDAGAVASAWQAMAGGGAQVIVDSSTFLIGERKLGLGRSAAVIAAATAAFRRLAGEPLDPTALRRAALAANARFQAGRGSGGDIAAVVHGGVVEVRRGADDLAVATRHLPAGLHLVAGWTGDSAHTTPLLAQFEAAVATRPAALSDLCDTAEAGADALARDHADDFCRAIDRAARALARLGDDLDLPIYTPALQRLVAVAERVGAVAKPSGAGGGDCGIALATSAAQAAAVRIAWQEAGIVPLPIAIAPEGVTVGD